MRAVYTDALSDVASAVNLTRGYGGATNTRKNRAPARATIASMLAKRLRTLSIFAGGCLSGAVLIVVWQSEPRTATDRAPARNSASSLEMPSEVDAAPSGDDRRTPAKNVHEEAETGESPAAKRAPTAPKNEEAAEASTAESGRSVSDVLAHLEAAYRQQLAVAPATGSDAATGNGTRAPATTDPQSIAAAQTAAALVPASAPVAPAPVQAAPARAEAPVAVAATTSLPAAVPAVALAAPAVVAPAVAAPAPAAPLPAAPAVALPAATSALATAPGVAPTQNVSVGSIHQGDTYHVQQVAVMQYVPMFMPFPYPGYGYPQAQPTNTRSMQPKRVPYPTTLTNPDNPWGFNFPPSLEMVK